LAHASTIDRICPEPTFSRHRPTKNMLRRLVEEVGTATT
jgi:hypothetical protein